MNIDKAIKKDTLPVVFGSIVSMLRARLVYEPYFGNDGLTGCLFREDNYDIIGINSRSSHFQQRFTIAHLLGHLVLHRKSVYIEKEIYDFSNLTEEREANMFAVSLLMPQKLVLSELRKSGHRDKASIVTVLARKFLVADTLMEGRLVDLGILTLI